MTIALQSHGAAAGDGSGAGAGAAVVTLNTSSGAGANLIVVILADYAANATAGFSDSINGTSGWTRLTAAGTGFTVRETILYNVSPGVGSSQVFTAQGAGCYPAIAVMAFSLASGGYDGQQNDSGANNISGSSGAWNQPTGNVTPDTTNTLVVAGCGIYGPGESNVTNSPDAILDHIMSAAGVNFGVASTYQIQTSATTVQETFASTDVTFVAMASSIAVFKADAAGGASIVPLYMHRTQQRLN